MSVKMKKPTSAYNFFQHSCIEDNKRQNKTDYKDLMEFNKHCAQIWKSKPEAEKKKFRIMEECDKKRYNCEKKINRKEMHREKLKKLLQG